MGLALLRVAVHLNEVGLQRGLQRVRLEQAALHRGAGLAQGERGQLRRWLRPEGLHQVELLGHALALGVLDDAGDATLLGVVVYRVRATAAVHAVVRAPAAA